MSSILRALKKVDKETQKSFATVDQSLGINTRTTIIRNVQSNWKGIKLSYVCVAGAFLAVIGFFIFFKSDIIKPNPTPVTAPLPQSANMAAEKLVAQNPTIIPFKRDRQAKLKTGKIASTKPSRQRSPIAIKTSKSPTGFSQNRKLPTSPSSIGMGNRPLVIKETTFALQALVWSKDIDGRFAVINDQIVREGDFFEGVLVKKIDWDHVVLEKAGAIIELKHRHGQ